MQQHEVTILNKLGLHARAAAKLVATASRFGSEIYLCRENQTVNGKSIMGVMMLAASQGTKLFLQVNGTDESEAVLAITKLIQNKFEEGE